MWDFTLTQTGTCAVFTIIYNMYRTEMHTCVQVLLAIILLIFIY